jgi:hypothetical protein
MSNCNTHTYTGTTAVTDATTFLATLDDTKLLAVTSFVTANTPTIIIVYKT